MTRTEKSPESKTRRFSPLDDSMICMKVGHDLTYEAQEGLIPCLIGRDAEISRIVSLLCRRGLRNLIITGDPGVGKTALVGELARRIALDQVPSVLRETRIIQTSFADMWAYVASSEDWGKYLDTLKKFLEECQQIKAILFMDEIHSMFGHQYSMQYLRPFLSSGKLTILGATTDQEYYTFIDRNRATARRFQLFRIEEASELDTIQILKAAQAGGSDLEEVAPLDDETLTYLVRLTNAYMPYQCQPSKALNILDEAIVSKLAYKDSCPITNRDIRKAVCRSVGIPEEAVSSPRERLETMEDVLNAHILGQSEAIARLCRRLFISKASMSVTPDRPDGVFLLAGPTGVGKTELARALAAYINGNEKDLIRVDMSALAESWSIHSLLGMPGRDSADNNPQNVPLLTRQLRARPYSVLLLDEIEKAHRSVQLLFLHAFDTGRFIDNLGNEIFLRNAIVIMTTNVGFSVRQPIIGMPGQTRENMINEHEDAAMKAIKEAFPKEFLGRVDDILFFKPLTPEIMRGFVGQKVRQLEQITGKRIEITEKAETLLCEKGFHHEYGARDLNRAVDELLGYKLALFKFSANWDAVRGIKVSRSRHKNELEIAVA